MTTNRYRSQWRCRNGHGVEVALNLVRPGGGAAFFIGGSAWDHCDECIQHQNRQIKAKGSNDDLDMHDAESCEWCA